MFKYDSSGERISNRRNLESLFNKFLLTAVLLTNLSYVCGQTGSKIPEGNNHYPIKEPSHHSYLAPVKTEKDTTLQDTIPTKSGAWIYNKEEKVYEHFKFVNPN